MLKKLISIIMVSVLSLSLLVGCSSELTKVDSNNTLTQVQDIMGSNYKVLQASLNDGILVVKTQIDYSGDWDNLFKLNLHVIEDLATGLDLSNIKELQYWSVCQTTDGGTKKTFACTMGKEQLQMIQNKQVFATEIDNMTSKMTDLYLDSELLQGLSKDVAGQIVINTTKEQNDTEDEKYTTTKEQQQEEKQTTKQQPAKEETKKQTTKQQTKEQQQEQQKENNTKDLKSNTNYGDDGDADIQFLCPNCNHTLENPVEEYGCPWCCFYPGEEEDSNYNDVYENEPEDNNTNNENLYWCDRCKCFSTSKHDHTYEEAPVDYNESDTEE